jgi:DNA polymerase-3 subunit epsilon
MNTILFYDTETTGLPNWSMPSEDPSQPRVIELAAELCEESTGITLGQMNVVIRPSGWTIPAEIAQLTGITQELAEAVGVPMDSALSNFLELWMNADQRGAHNESFDMRMIRIEIMRHDRYMGETMTTETGAVPFADYWKKAPAYCTQSNSVKIINLPPTAKMIAAKRLGPKSPNLAEAYEFFTGQKLEGAHRAMADVQACKAVYYGIKNHGLKDAA